MGDTLSVGYQSLYLDVSTVAWEERIVFHDPIFDHEIAGVAALKSMRLEKFPGLVVASTKPTLRRVRKEVSEKDAKEGLGRLNNCDIIQILTQIFEEAGASIVYQQNLDSKIAGQFEVELPTGKNIERTPIINMEDVKTIKGQIEQDLGMTNRHGSWTANSFNSFSRKEYFSNRTQHFNHLKSLGYQTMSLDSIRFVRRQLSHDVVISPQDDHVAVSVTLNALPRALTTRAYRLFRYGSHSDSQCLSRPSLK